jgi:hypothetical protein
VGASAEVQWTLQQDTALQVMLETEYVEDADDTWEWVRERLVRRTGVGRTVFEVQTRAVALRLDTLVVEACPSIRIEVVLCRRHFREIDFRRDAVFDEKLRMAGKPETIDARDDDKNNNKIEAAKCQIW